MLAHQSCLWWQNPKHPFEVSKGQCVLNSWKGKVEICYLEAEEKKRGGKKEKQMASRQLQCPQGPLGSFH